MQAIIIDQKYTLIRSLGEGGFGEVWLVRANKEYRAVKFIERKFTIAQSQLAKVTHEAKMLQYVSSLPEASRYVIKFYGLYIGKFSTKPLKDYYVLEMEYFEGYTLLDIYKAHTIKNLPELCTVINHLVASVRYLHTTGVAHRDIKLANVMLNKERLVLVDFGLACFFKECYGTGGTSHYQGPEIKRCQGGKLCQIDWAAVDVYALGKTIMYMAESAHVTSAELKMLVQKMTSADPSFRPFLVALPEKPCSKNATPTPFQGSFPTEELSKTVADTSSEE